MPNWTDGVDGRGQILERLEGIGVGFRLPDHQDRVGPEKLVRSAFERQDHALGCDLLDPDAGVDGDAEPIEPSCVISAALLACRHRESPAGFDQMHSVVSSRQKFGDFHANQACAHDHDFLAERFSFVLAAAPSASDPFDHSGSAEHMVRLVTR